SITPALHWHVADVTVDGVSIGAVTNYTFTVVTTDHLIAATFAIDTNPIVASSGANGSVAPAGTTNVGFAGSQTFTITPTPHYHVLDVLADGSSVGAVTSYTFSNVTGSHTIDVSFTIDTNPIVASTGANGAISPPGTSNVPYGTDQPYSITPDAH